MNDILKQRLVGALVLIALGVVFWPVLFVESERGSLDRQSQIEPMPALEDVTIPAPQPLPGVEPVRPAPEPTDAELAAAATPPPQASEAADTGSSPSQAPDKPAPAAAAVPESTARTAPPEAGQQAAAIPALPAKAAAQVAPESPALDDQGIPIAWVLQVASVSTRDKADKLTADLIARDYKAYHRAIRRDDVVLYRVFIGPVFEREKLTAVKHEVDQQLQVSAIIARYVP